MRKKFELKKKIKKAVLKVSALGFCEIYLNNAKITDDLYVTPLSEYNERTADETNPTLAGDCYFNDKLGYTIYVNEYDVTRFVVNGDNCCGVILAGGWYRSGLDKHNSYRNYGDLKLCFSLSVEYEDGSAENVYSDRDCKYKESFLTQAGIFHEEQDERKEISNFSDFKYDDSDWLQAEVCDAPKSKYLINDCPPNRIIKYVRPKLLKTYGKTKVFALDENITGFPVISGLSKNGDEITCVCGETLDDDLSVNEFHSYSQNTSFISDGRKEHALRFTWHGFQYFSVTTTGDIDKLNCEKCAVVYADVKNTSEFECSNETLNFLYSAYVRSQNENFQCGVPTDCPQIERKGYTGDGQLLCDSGMNLFDSRKLYKKWLRDICDVQDSKTGFVHNTAPCFIGCSGGPGGWGMAIINVPYEYYKTYGDENVLHTYYEQMLKYCEFLDNEAKGGLVRFTERKGACLGDWAGPVKPYLPEPFVNTCLYTEALQRLSEIARIIGKKDDAEYILKKSECLKELINREYRDKNGNYCGNVQASNAFAVNVGLGDERTLDNLVKKYETDGCFDTGIFGTKILVKVLCEKGYGNLAIDLLASRKEISYYSWKEQGATTLWESWKNPRSLNHPMFGSPVIYLFKEILGIKQGVGCCGYRNVEIRPVEQSRLERASGTLKTVSGEISVAFKKKDGLTHFVIKIPEGVVARFVYGGTEKKLSAGENLIDI